MTDPTQPFDPTQQPSGPPPVGPTPGAEPAPFAQQAPFAQPTQPAAAPGWYPEPGTGAQRWWDGQAWGAYASQVPGAVAGANRKDKTVAGVLGIVLGGFGAHKFYLGRTTPALIMLLGTIFGSCLGAILIVPLLLPMAFGVIGFVEGIIYLTKSDAEFQQTYVVQGKDWF